MSLGPLERVGGSSSVSWPVESMWMSLWADWSVDHTPPCGSAAMPNGAAPVAEAGYGVKLPVCRRTRLFDQESAAHTAPSVATASRPNWVSLVGSGNDSTRPSGVRWPMASPIGSVNQTPP